MALSTPYANNTSRSIATQDVGIKISQPGFNAQNASSSQLIFDSSWPSVQSTFTKYVASGATNGAIAHGLGFPPFTRIYTLDSSGNITVAGVAGAVDSTYVYILEGGFVPDSDFPSTANYFIDCTNVDLSADVDYPNLPLTSVNSAYDPNYGIKIVKLKKNINSKDGRDFILHSRYRSPLIQAVKTEATAASGNAAIALGLGAANAIQYTNANQVPTWNYGFIKVGSTSSFGRGYPAGSYLYAPYFSQAYPRTFTDGITTYIAYISIDQGATIVVLRDPLLAPNQVQAFY